MEARTANLKNLSSAWFRWERNALRFSRQCRGQDLPGVIAYEKRADQLVDRIHELLDNTLILHFDIADAMRLTGAR